MVPFLIFLVVGGVVAAAAASTAAPSTLMGGGGGGAPIDPNLDKLQAQLDATAAKDEKDRALRTKETNDKLDDWGKAVNSVIPGGGTWLAGTAKLALSIEGSVVRWVQGDWNSDAQKARALAAVKGALDVGIVPEPFNADEDFAKTYADKVEAEITKAGDFGQPWKAVVADYTASLLRHAGDTRIMSIVPTTSAAYSDEFGQIYFCQALAALTGKSNPTSPAPGTTGGPAAGQKYVYPLANLVAAVASAEFGTDFVSDLSIAYAAVGRVLVDHPTMCSGRGFKGDANTFDYEYAPYLYVLRAWIDLLPADRRAKLLATK